MSHYEDKNQETSKKGFYLYSNNMMKELVY